MGVVCLLTRAVDIEDPQMKFWKNDIENFGLEKKSPKKGRRSRSPSPDGMRSRPSTTAVVNLSDESPQL